MNLGAIYLPQHIFSPFLKNMATSFKKNLNIYLDFFFIVSYSKNQRITHVIFVFLHVSQGAMHRWHSALSITTFAASGSAWKLNSPQTVIFPSPCEFPPISIILFSRDVNDGSALIHAATLVKGPNPISVILPVEKGSP